MATIDADTLRGLRAGTYHVSITSLWASPDDCKASVTARAKDAADEPYATAVFNTEARLEFGGCLVQKYAPLRAYASVSSPRFSELWQTFLAIARPGDDVRIIWSANGYANVHIREASLNVDSCELEIRRGAGRRTKRLRFHIDQTICPSNTARMFTSGEHNHRPVDGPHELI